MRYLLPIFVLALLALPATAPAAADQEATIQDDNLFLYQTPEKQRAALQEAAALGADRIRATILWRAIAPKPESRRKPAGFDGANPESYPPGTFAKYDNLVREAAALGLKVNFNVTGPSPTWANKKPPRSDIADNYKPSPAEFQRFVTALGTRYSGSYSDGGYGTIGRVDYWSIWNEPNHSGWLTPTWEKRKGRFVERSASLYRSLLDAAWRALHATGHGGDTIIFGETAPAGNDSKDVKRFMKPLVFVRALYCLDGRLKRLKGKAAKRLSCPKGKRAFVKAHPALFRATGYAHHPYQLLTAPTVKPRERDHVTIANLKQLARTLDKAQRRYGKSRRLPLYLTEFGYQTPPDPIGVSFARQARYINQAEYMAARNRRVRTMSQFLLVDGGDPVGLTFQSGLKSISGKRKPAYAAYRLPVWVTGNKARRKVWGLVRPAAEGARVGAVIEYRKKGAKRFKRVGKVKTKGARNDFTRTVRARGKGTLRVRSGELTSRLVKLR